MLTKKERTIKHLNKTLKDGLTVNDFIKILMDFPRDAKVVVFDTEYHTDTYLKADYIYLDNGNVVIDSTNEEDE